ncbi:hypothetical protein CBF34_06000 [Vagococcus penaei]|uniref:Gamma-glutamylcyclotransferase AIG2-like domain-containing protein n=1 Tax=Vagococcus penaei TaxID=633807 RepID=A0A1Q2D3L7_9ENTE|nr:gamma-glutamylcyclotransferase family protein [Vagococcus penaei]AQP52921.1 hypothetical protein BW732_00890 [Vagococcus penaei]RSU02622.1 hypothetical protein CBF34_06000 [Vagococcus penaei]
MTKTYYLAYGSNMNLEQMSKRCPDASIIGKGELDNYQLLFKGTYPDSYATIIPNKGTVVPIILWAISEQDELALDVYEDYPNLYRKEEINVKINQESYQAMVYIMNGDPSLTPPTISYYSAILAGYLANDIPIDTLHQALLDTYESSVISEFN